MTMFTLRAALVVGVVFGASIACVLPPKSAGQGDPSAQGTAGSTAGSVTASGTDGPGMTSGIQPPAADDTTVGASLSCRDAVDCVIDCAAAMDPIPPRTDLTCFLGCERGLAVDEALALFRLSECTVDACTEAGFCESREDTGTSTSGTTGDSFETEGGTDPQGSGVGPSNPCLDCVLANLLDPQPPLCIEFANECT